MNKWSERVFARAVAIGVSVIRGSMKMSNSSTVKESAANAADTPGQGDSMGKKQVEKHVERRIGRNNLDEYITHGNGCKYWEHEDKTVDEALKYCNCGFREFEAKRLFETVIATEVFGRIRKACEHCNNGVIKYACSDGIYHAKDDETYQMYCDATQFWFWLADMGFKPANGSGPVKVEVKAEQKALPMAN